MPRVARPTISRCPWKSDRWMIDGLRDDQGKRFRRFFETKEAAKSWLSSHKEVSLVEGRAGLEFTSAQRADACRALSELTAFPGATLTDAARHFAEHLRRTERTVPVSEMVATFTAAKKADGRSTEHLKDIRSRLSEFAKSFGKKPVAGITTAELDDWLRGLAVGPQTRLNYRRVLHSLFSFACARNLARENPVARTERPKVVREEPGILTPEEISGLLRCADPKIRPAIAIAAFSGLRPNEIRRLGWSDIKLTDRLIVVSAGTSKTASRRLAPIPENLVDWLMQAPTREGRVQPRNARRLLVSARTKAKTQKWPHDCLRHSWCSYRLALLSDAARVAAEAGHSQAVLHRHYKGLVLPADAARWFAVSTDILTAEPIPFQPQEAQA